MKSKLFIVFLFLLVLCSIGCVAATDLNNDTQDIGEIQISDNDDILDSSPSSIQDLKNQISNAEENSVINLTNDYVTTSSCSIDISKSLTIDGQGHTIDCN